MKFCSIKRRDSQVENGVSQSDPYEKNPFCFEGFLIGNRKQSNINIADRRKTNRKGTLVPLSDENRAKAPSVFCFLQSVG